MSDDNVTPLRPIAAESAEGPIVLGDEFVPSRILNPDMDDEDLMQGATKMIVWQRNGDNVPVTSEYNFVHRMCHDDDNTLHFFHVVFKNSFGAVPLQRLKGESGLDFAARARAFPGAKYLKRVINNGEWCDIEYEDFYVYTRKAPHVIIEDTYSQ